MSGLEFLPFLAIPTLVCTIIQTVAQCKKLQLDMRAQKAQEAASNDSQISGHLRGHSRDVCNTFNNCVVILGSQFTAGDGTFYLLFTKLKLNLSIGFDNYRTPLINFLA